MSNQQSTKIEIYTDGGCHGNPGPGGWAYLLCQAGGAGEQRSLLAEQWGAEQFTTNNQMELRAAIEALSALHALRLPLEAVGLWTDSEYVKNGITVWIQKWKKNGWRTANKQPVKNAELWRRLDELAALFPLSWHWVRGHNGDPLNERCDELTQTAIESIEGAGKR
ncbi:MAG: ribonuclease HI [Spirochaetaceae bacterium]|jgi:ribonuclease HI|nr:ribonuclease HI [Spirochaetaceae bacterium]